MKIKKARHIGVVDTYSPEMASTQHNYITAQSGAVHRNSHAVSYCLWAYRCLWLKAHYPEEWWASVLGNCNQDKLERYMSAARAEGIRFGEVDINRLTIRPVAHAGTNQTGDHPHVALGLISLKNVGDSLSTEFADADDATHDHDSIDDFVKEKGKHKVLLERLIKLGAFKNIHQNIKATWRWYLHKYCTGRIVRVRETGTDPLMKRNENGNFVENKYTDPSEKILITQLKEHHRILLLQRDGWSKESIEAERKRQVDEYKKLYPKRKNIPKKVVNWQPNPNDTAERVMSLYDDDYELTEILEFEKEFLGYHWHSPCDLYNISPDADIEHAKLTGRLEGVITKKFEGKTRNDRPMLKLIITDGHQECLVILWEDAIRAQPGDTFDTDTGVRLRVNYDEDRGSFTLQRGTLLSKLWSKKGWEKFREGDLDAD